MDQYQPADPVTEGVVVLAVDELGDRVADRTAEEPIRVTVAADLQGAVETCHPHVEVVVLDSRLSGRPPAPVLAEIRERTGGCHTVLLVEELTAVDVESQAFDEYLGTIVSDRDLCSVIRHRLRHQQYHASVQELYACARARAALKSELSEEQLRSTELYTDLTTRFESLRTTAQRLVPSLGTHASVEST